MQSDSARPGLAGLVLITTGLIAGLHRMGDIEGLRPDWSDPVQWLNDATAADAVATIGRFAGLLIGYWVLTSALACFLTAARPRSRLFAVTRRVTLPGIRRIADRAAAVVLVTAIASSPLQAALADEQPSPATTFDISSDGVPVPLIRFGTDDAAPETGEAENPEQQQTVVVTPPTNGPAAASVALSEAATETRTYQIRSGDNLWHIAEHRVGEAGGIDEVTVYWRRLIADNRDTLRSGDPNLIFPGEIVTLPALETAP